ncbi:hypothetical protein SK069_08450 [Patulibacter brassicae]|uniref:Intradiol ring-cleavage dioxygenases domain-containing protein n=1 Tax=Patulibacter brassicae TaxID=1705717 RepID=A0ABU4VIK2_9ACTN|nr:hypothetical protein [Patulibacter brassicae]MDX8151618.1 hypothetical protein [Patulibacter brassicae]
MIHPHDEHRHDRDHDHDEATILDAAGPGLTRRHAVAAGGLTGAALLLAQASGPGGLLDALGLDVEAQAATAACTLTAPAKTVGPYFVEEGLNRSDIRSDPSTGVVQAGVPVTLSLVVVDSTKDCAPIAGATVDVWHANAKGTYSDVSQNSSVGQKYLRGSQVTDADGKVTFVTVFPGWYSGRAIHVHFKVRTFDGTRTTYDFTSQLFFDPSLTSQVLQTSAYSGRGNPDTTNATDNIYGSDGSRLLVTLTGDPASALAGTFVVSLANAPTTTSSGSSSGSAGSSSGSGSSSSGSSAASAATVDASLQRARWRRTARGRRVLRLTFDVDEAVTVTARITRNGKTIVRKKVALRTGTQVVHLRIPAATARGRARVAVAFVDADGATSSARRTVTIPKRA